MISYDWKGAGDAGADCPTPFREQPAMISAQQARNSGCMGNLASMRGNAFRAGVRVDFPTLKMHGNGGRYEVDSAFKVFTK